MALPKPEPGLVISFSYLWRDEHRRGRDEGRKDRPCVLLAVEARSATSIPGSNIVTVVPITHSPPTESEGAIELPPRVKAALGLDDQRSWVIVEEANRFVWPGFDLRPISGKRKFDYGLLPPRLHDRLVAGFLAAAARQRLAIVPRD